MSIQKKKPFFYSNSHNVKAIIIAAVIGQQIQFWHNELHSTLQVNKKKLTNYLSYNSHCCSLNITVWGPRFNR